MVKKLDSGKWQGSYNDPSGIVKRPKKSFNTKTEASRWVVESVAERNRGTVRKNTPILRTVSDMIEHYKSLARYKHLRPYTKLRYEQLIRHFTDWSLENSCEYLSSWDRDKARKFEGWAHERFRGKGVVHILSIARLLFHEELLRENPAIKENPFLIIKLPKIPREDSKMFTPEEINMILAVSDEYTKHLWHLLLYTGMRVSEVLWLRHEHWAGDTIKIQSQSEWSPKTFKAIRTIPNLRPEAIEALEYFSTINTGKPYLFSGDKPRRKAHIGDKFRAIKKRVKKNYGHELKGSPHSFRHTFASLLWQLDVSDRVTADLLGHENANVTQRVYAQLSKENLQQGMEKLKYLKSTTP